MTGTLKIGKALATSFLLLIGGASNPENQLQREITSGGGDISDSRSIDFWDKAPITPNVDKYASKNAYNKFNNLKGNIGHSCTNSFKYLYTYNLSQNELNSDFNLCHNSTRTYTYQNSSEIYTVNGTCTEVAVANMVISHETDIGFPWHHNSTYAEAYFLFHREL